MDPRYMLGSQLFNDNLSFEKPWYGNGYKYVPINRSLTDSFIVPKFVRIKSKAKFNEMHINYYDWIKTKV